MNQVINLREKVKEKTPQPPARNKTETASFEADIKNTRPDHDSVNLISWEAPTFNYNPNKKYLALVIIFIFLGAGTLLFLKKDFLLVIFLVLYALMLIFYANKKPEVSKITLNQSSIKIDDQIYYYRNIKSFWLDYEPSGLKELSIEPKKWYLPYIKIPIEKENPLNIRSLVLNYVQEKEHEKSLVDLISKKIGL